jgi:hypothetical protein
MARTAKFVVAFVAIAALSGGIAAAAAPSGESKAKPNAVVPLVNAPSVITQAEYVPLAPCRILDTRHGGGKLAGSTSRAINVAGTTGFAPQGGKSGGCGVPLGASAAALSVTTTNAGGTGYLTLYANGSARPIANQASFAHALNTTTQVNAPLNLTNGHANVFASRAVDVVVDVAGYYSEPIAGSVSSSGTLGYKSAQVLSATHNTTGSYTVHFSRNVGGCILVATTEQSYYNVGGYTTGTNITIFTRDVTQAGGPYTDAAFTFTVTC